MEKRNRIREMIIWSIVIIGILWMMPFILFVIMPNGISDKVHMDTSTGEQFYFEGSWETTFPKLYNCRYALYEIKDGKKILIREGQDNRKSEFYFKKDEFDSDKDLFSLKYDYKDNTYIVHKIEDYILHKKIDDEKYTMVELNNVLSNSREYGFLYDFIKENIKKTNDYDKRGFEFLMKVYKENPIYINKFGYEEIIHIIENKYSGTEYLKNYLYYHGNSNYEIWYVIDVYFMYLKDNEKYGIVSIKNVMNNPEKYVFLSPIYIDKLKSSNNIYDINKISECLIEMKCEKSYGIILEKYDYLINHMLNKKCDDAEKQDRVERIKNKKLELLKLMKE
ncbi:MAG: hypothetical protein N4A57_12745 [Anaeromicrobium sp.]|uniref:hypothetical protein n=1 Tax=Anaeromicrobium sp. TaxID=1929132 RepID=UPI0025E3862F|nr:hypothetical protein [Anaeromicrobium sp.]MCT4595118.1 hypothetical protein [Anaeromicrobium sp.]